MKIKGLMRILIISALCFFTLYVGISHSGVVGSKHDLTPQGTGMFAYDLDWATYGRNNEQVCVFCHTPHKSNTAIKETTVFNGVTSSYQDLNAAGPMLLWNRSLANLAGGFTAYTSSTLNVSITQIRAYSLLCLSCHDGVGAMNVMLNYPEDTTIPLEVIAGASTMGEIFNGNGLIGWGPNIGDRTQASQSLNLANDHPISFDYTSSHPDVISGGLNTPDTSNGYVQGQPNLKLYPNPNNPSQKSSLECSTCHDVHNQGGTGGDPLYPFLRVSKVNSQICTSCHFK